MVLEDAGRAQSLDLRSGERGEGAVALYYPLRTATLDREFRSLGQVNGVPPVTTVDMDGRLKDAGLLPYYPGRGWAARERAWLCVTLELVAPMGYEEVTIDEAASFALETPRGGTIPAEPGSFTVANDVTWQGPHNGTMLFNVSDSFEAGTLTFTPHGSVTLEQWEGTLTGLEPVSAPVRLEG